VDPFVQDMLDQLQAAGVYIPSRDDNPAPPAEPPPQQFADPAVANGLAPDVPYYGPPADYSPPPRSPETQRALDDLQATGTYDPVADSRPFVDDWGNVPMTPPRPDIPINQGFQPPQDYNPGALAASAPDVYRALSLFAGSPRPPAPPTQEVSQAAWRQMFPGGARGAATIDEQGNPYIMYPQGWPLDPFTLTHETAHYAQGLNAQQMRANEPDPARRAQIPGMVPVLPRDYPAILGNLGRQGLPIQRDWMLSPLEADADLMMGATHGYPQVYAPASNWTQGWIDYLLGRRGDMSQPAIPQPTPTPAPTVSPNEPKPIFLPDGQNVAPPGYPPLPTDRTPGPGQGWYYAPGRGWVIPVG
jgi:hypothetical protein